MLKKVILKLKSILTNNVGLKMIAIFIASIVWLTVVNINDPEKSIVIYNIPITITDEDVLSEQGMVYDKETDYMVNVTVKGKRSVVTKLTQEDFTATASLKELSRVDAIPVHVKIKNTSSAIGVTIVRQSVQTINVKVENLTSREFDINIGLRGNLPRGYVHGVATLYVDKVTVSAPTSILETIDKAVAICKLDNIREDIRGKNCKIVLYDREERELNFKKYGVQLSVKKVQMDLEIMKEIAVEIEPLKVESIGKPATHCIVTEINLKKSRIKVMGKSDILEGFSTIDISSAIDITNDDKDVVKNIDVSDLLPEGIAVSGDSIIPVEIKIDRYTKKNLMISAQDIELKNVNATYTASVLSEKISVECSGRKKILNKLQSKDITVSVDLSGRKNKGVHHIKADIRLPDGVKVVQDVVVKIELKNR